MTTVRPSSVISRIMSSTAWDDSGSRPEVGSSNKRRSGSCITERARARRVFMPVEYPPTCWSSACSMPNRAADSRMAFAAASRRPRP